MHRWSFFFFFSSVVNETTFSWRSGSLLRLPSMRVCHRRAILEAAAPVCGPRSAFYSKCGVGRPRENGNCMAALPGVTTSDDVATTNSGYMKLAGLRWRNHLRFVLGITGTRAVVTLYRDGMTVGRGPTVVAMTDCRKQLLERSGSFQGTCQLYC